MKKTNLIRCKVTVIDNKAIGILSNRTKFTPWLQSCCWHFLGKELLDKLLSGDYDLTVNELKRFAWAVKQERKLHDQSRPRH